ncbi:outer membrane protein assembly factor BamB family protein [Neorhodopirellula pilleata]|uniref:Outer membrane biogenesis protein BamB n=1 Tax=Neorhodopirellula pilleata TaxID=2714738 RepID=A0A5C5ZV03_9BACT|nr:PQQ-binding-like beta-propeller repeat protein [Neorhodopirellula pilleata]TWT91362.1 outer membrane biogenesis protein BamB [Neorhodopirellula pilleata]
MTTRSYCQFHCLNDHSMGRSTFTIDARWGAVARCILVVISLSLSMAYMATVQATDDWSRFHGSDGSGKVASGALPTTWTSQDYDWTMALGGTDVGSPVVAGGVVYLLDATTTKEQAKSVDLLAVDLKTGQELWRRAHPITDIRRHARNSPASTTPVVDGDRVFFAYGDAKGAYLHAYDTDGQKQWSRDLGPWTGYHGFGTSPMVVGSKVILFNSQQVDKLEDWQVAGESRMMAFDRTTGEDVWSTPLKATRPCYGVPAIYSGSPTQLIAANTGNGIFSLDAQSGRMLWSLEVFDKRSCSSPLVVTGLEVGDLAIGTCGSGGGGNILSAVRIPTQPGQQPEEVIRITSSAPYVPTSVVKDHLLFTVSDAGVASCFDLNDGGKKLWNERLGGNFGASPIIVGDRLLMIALDGTAHVTEASAMRSPVSEFDLGGSAGATPAFASGRLILRVGNQLHCLHTERLAERVGAISQRSR